MACKKTEVGSPIHSTHLSSENELRLKVQMFL